MLTADPVLKEQCSQYLSVNLVWCFGLFYQTYAQRLLQAVGDTKFSMYSLVIGAVTNIILDPIMIASLHPFLSAIIVTNLILLVLMILILKVQYGKIRESLGECFRTLGWSNDDQFGNLAETLSRAYKTTNEKIISETNATKLEKFKKIKCNIEKYYKRPTWLIAILLGQIACLAILLIALFATKSFADLGSSSLAMIQFAISISLTFPVICFPVFWYFRLRIYMLKKHASAQIYQTIDHIILLIFTDDVFSYGFSSTCWVCLWQLLAFIVCTILMIATDLNTIASVVVIAVFRYLWSIILAKHEVKRANKESTKNPALNVRPINYETILIINYAFLLMVYLVALITEAAAFLSTIGFVYLVDTLRDKIMTMMNVSEGTGPADTQI